MEIIDAIQGSQNWLSIRSNYFTASEAPAMMGASKYQTRTDLLRQKHTGLTTEVDDNKQRLFNLGHEAEAAVRPLVEAFIGAELFPATGTLEVDGLPLLASFDGVTMLEDVCWENKLYNDKLAYDVRAGNIEPHYYWQLEQQILVSGAERCYFTTSDGTPENTVGMWYTSLPERRAALIAGWKQFAVDLAAFEHTEIVERPKADPIKDLPAVVINASGGLSVCNLPEVTPIFDLFILNAKTELVTDEDFANGEETAKKSRSVSKTLKMKAKEVIDQIATVGDAVRTLELYAEKFDKLGLTLEKAVKDQKETIKGKILAEGRQAYTLHIAALETEIEPIRLVCPQPDFAGAMKSKRTLASLHDAVNTELANATIAADAVAHDYRSKLDSMRTFESYKFLFNDLQHIIGKPRADFDLLVDSRIEGHKKAEAEKVEAAKAAETARIAAAVEAERKAGEARAAAAIEAAQKQAEADQRAKSNEATHAEPQATAAPQAPLPSSPPINTRAVVVEHQDEIAEFLNYIDVDDKKRKSIRPYLVEFIKWQALRRSLAMSKRVAA